MLSNSSSVEESTLGTYLNHQIGLMALLDDAEDEPQDVPETCASGIGGLLSLQGYETWGRDIELPCKDKACPVCAKRRERKIGQIMNNFAGRAIHAVLLPRADGDLALRHSRECVPRCSPGCFARRPRQVRVS